MAGGVWSQTDKPIRPGFYMNFVAAAQDSIQSGVRGVVAIPIRANWGPAKQIVEITNEKELIDTFGSEITADFTAYECIRLILLGSPKKVLGYRLVDGSAAKASKTLKDDASTDVLTIATKYETEKDFKVTVRDNAIDNNKQDIVLYEGAKQLYVFTFAKGTGVIDKAVVAINDDKMNKWIDANKVTDGNNTLANISSQNFSGGNAGVADIVNADYVNAMSAFEARVFNSFTLDGVTDSSLQTSVKAWVERLRCEGKMVMAFVGGSAEDDQDIANANSRSASFNHEGMVNVGISAEIDEVWYTSGKVACYVCGKAAGQSLKESLTYAVTPFDDVSPRLTHSQVVSALQSGTLVLIHDGEKVIIEQGINTLTSLREGQNNSFKKIKTMKIMDAIETDTAKAAHDSYIGKVLNNEDGQVAVLSAIKNYFETLSPTLIANDFIVEVDKEKQVYAGADEFYWKWSAKLIDSMEKIFGTGIIR